MHQTKLTVDCYPLAVFIRCGRPCSSAHSSAICVSSNKARKHSPRCTIQCRISTRCTTKVALKNDLSRTIVPFLKDMWLRGRRKKVFGSDTTEQWYLSRFELRPSIKTPQRTRYWQYWQQSQAISSSSLLPNPLYHIRCSSYLDLLSSHPYFNKQQPTLPKP